MSQRSPSNLSNKLHPNLKKGRWIWLLFALLVLAINMVLAGRGKPLPREITNLAQEVVEEALWLEEDGPIQRGLSSPTPIPITDVVIFPSPQPDDALLVADAAGQGQETFWSNPSGDFDYYVLALSWEPAFCETEPCKVECTTQSVDRYDATHFVLHGLWPSGEGDIDDFSYCDLSQEIVRQDKEGRWCELPVLSLSAVMQDALPTFMPGALSCLHHHEWYKHGVCAGISPAAYFALSERLVTLFSQTRFNQYVVDRVGEQVSRWELLDQFDAEFGLGASDFLSLRCEEVDGTPLLTEIHIVLAKELSDLSEFGALFPKKPVSPGGSCPQQFEIDQVGLRD